VCRREDPYYSPEWTETAWPTIKHYLAPLLMQGELDAGGIGAARFARVRGHRMSKAALENAVWTPRHGRSRSPSGSCWAVRDVRSPAAFRSVFRIRRNSLLGKIETELAAGYRRIKIKVKPDGI